MPRSAGGGGSRPRRPPRSPPPAARCGGARAGSGAARGSFTCPAPAPPVLPRLPKSFFGRLLAGGGAVWEEHQGEPRSRRCLGLSGPSGEEGESERSPRALAPGAWPWPRSPRVTLLPGPLPVSPPKCRGLAAPPAFGPVCSGDSSVPGGGGSLPPGGPVACLWEPRLGSGAMGLWTPLFLAQIEAKKKKEKKKPCLNVSCGRGCCAGGGIPGRGPRRARRSLGTRLPKRTPAAFPHPPRPRAGSAGRPRPRESRGGRIPPPAGPPPRHPRPSLPGDPAAAGTSARPPACRLSPGTLHLRGPQLPPPCMLPVPWGPVTVPPRDPLLQGASTCPLVHAACPPGDPVCPFPGPRISWERPGVSPPGDPTSPLLWGCPPSPRDPPSVLHPPAGGPRNARVFDLLGFIPPVLAEPLGQRSQELGPGRGWGPRWGQGGLLGAPGPPALPRRRHQFTPVGNPGRGEIGGPRSWGSGGAVSGAARARSAPGVRGGKGWR